MALRYWTATLTSFVLGVLEVILLLRFLQCNAITLGHSRCYPGYLHTVSRIYQCGYHASSAAPVFQGFALTQIVFDRAPI